MKKKILIFVLLLAIIGNFSYRVWGYREKYTTPYDPVFWKNKYLKSQWVVSNSKEGIGDDGLYAYAGWEYLHGKDPTLINPEMPPLGKYLIGLTILAFGNQAIFAILTGILSLFLLYLLSFEILKSKIYALATVAFFSMEPLFYTQLSAPYLDLLYLSTVLGFLYCTFKKNFLLSAFFLGFMAATKNSATSFLLGAVVSGAYVFLTDKKDLKKWLLTLPLSGLVLLLSYFQYFLLGHSLRDFLGAQKWILNFYAQGAKGVFGSVIPMLFAGRWYNWFGPVEKVNEWNLLWPILAVSAAIWTLVSRIKGKSGGLLIISLWILCYFIFLLFVPVWPRYLLLLLPFFYLTFFHALSRRIA